MIQSYNHVFISFSAVQIYDLTIFTCKTIFVQHVLRSVQKSYSPTTLVKKKRTTDSLSDLNIGEHACVMVCAFNSFSSGRVRVLPRISVQGSCQEVARSSASPPRSITVSYRGIRDLVSDQATKISVLTMKGHSTIDCLKDFEPDVLKTFCALRVLSFKILQRMFELVNTFSSQKFCSLWNQFLVEYYTQRVLLVTGNSSRQKWLSRQFSLPCMAKLYFHVVKSSNCHKN